MPDDEKQEYVLDNSAKAPLQIPGFNGVPINYLHREDNRFANGTWKQLPAITARELTMVRAMNMITDKINWHILINKASSTQAWYQEVCAIYPLLSQHAWDWCLAELKDKAIAYQENKFIRVLDTGSCVCKSDDLTRESLSSSLKQSLESLHSRHTSSDDNAVRPIVDPCMYPLVYGESYVFRTGKENNKSGSESLVELELTERHTDRRVDAADLERRIANGLREGEELYLNHSSSSRYVWSYKYQALPSEVRFSETHGTKVHIASYINNIDPRNESLYKIIEELMGESIKLWNECLIKDSSDFRNQYNVRQRGRLPLRILTFGLEWEHELPYWAAKFRVPPEPQLRRYLKALDLVKTIPKTAVGEDAKKRSDAKKHLKDRDDLKGIVPITVPSLEVFEKAKAYLELPEQGSPCSYDMPEHCPDKLRDIWLDLKAKNERIQKWKHPEPGTAFSYEEWKNGHSNKAIVDMYRTYAPWDDTEYHRPDYKPYTIALEDDFRDAGLQIIVKINSVELNANNPKFAGESWHVSGHWNEHIVACTSFVYDIENVTPVGISFRQPTELLEKIYHVQESLREVRTGQCHIMLPHPRHENKLNEIEDVATMLGFESGSLRFSYQNETRPYQQLGTVQMSQNRLLSWSRVLEHKLEPFKLVDVTKPGRFSQVKLYLIDPHYRVCSAANVPPQQRNWTEDVIREQLSRLPNEIIDEILQYVRIFTMAEDVAEKHRQQKMKELGWARAAKYSFTGWVGF